MIEYLALSILLVLTFSLGYITAKMRVRIHVLEALLDADSESAEDSSGPVPELGEAITRLNRTPDSKAEEIDIDKRRMIA